MRSSANTAACAAAVTASARSIVCSPSISTSGSTIGTRPASWQSAA